MSELDCCMNETDVTFKMAFLDEPDDVSNLQQSIWVTLVQQGFPGIGIVDVGSIIGTVIQ